MKHPTTTAPAPKRQPRTIDDVMADVQSRVPHLIEHCFLDRDWIWLCNVDLRGEANKPTREALKEIGFRFSQGGHVMPDGKTLGTWGHSCLRPMHPHHRPKPKRHESEDEEDDAARLAAMFA